MYIVTLAVTYVFVMYDIKIWFYYKHIEEFYVRRGRFRRFSFKQTRSLHDCDNQVSYDGFISCKEFIKG